MSGKAKGASCFRPGRYWMQELQQLAQALAEACGIDGDRLLLDSIEAMPEFRQESVREKTHP